MLKARPKLANMAVSYGDEHRAIHYAVMHREPEITRLLAIVLSVPDFYVPWVVPYPRWSSIASTKPTKK